MITIKIIMKYWGSGMLMIVYMMPVGMAMYFFAPNFDEMSLWLRTIIFLILSPIYFGSAQRWYWREKGDA